MQTVEIQDVLKYSYLYETFDKDLLEKTLKELKVENMQIYLSSHYFEEDEDFVDFETEPHYNTRF